MTRAGDSMPALQVSSTASADHGSLVDWLEPRNPLAFLRDGEGIIGIGEALRLTFSGATRITDAAAAWRSLVAAATVHDAVQRAGSGLVALGSFAFADASATTSSLVVPAVVLGRRDGVSWITRIAPTAGEPATDDRVAGGRVTEARAAPGEPFRVAFGAGRMSPGAYTAAVAAAVEHIRSGAARKIVVARDLIGELPEDADLRLPIGRLAEAYPQTFTFAVDGLVGSSPETLVRVAGSTVSARVLAGTAARGADATADTLAKTALATSAKDLAEHAFALGSVIAALTPHASGLFASPQPFPLALPNLWHLASDVTGTLTDGASSLDLAAALHPTAAVAGTPTDAALRLIAQLEPADRGRYAGPVGWVGADGDGEWAVALRCAQVGGAAVRAFAGAGIVDDSDPARELAETELKFRPIVDAFA